MSELVIAVTGGRNYGLTKRGDPIARRREAEDERATLVMTLNALKPVLVLHGGATGADELARQWCLKNRVAYVEYMPNFAKHGSPAAYHVRNRDMIDDLKRYRKRDTEIALVAFPGGNGTKSTTELAKARRIRVVTPSDVEAGELTEARAEIIAQTSLAF